MDVGLDPRGGVLILRGELDYDSAVQLQEAADDVLVDRPRLLVLDCTALHFCDSSGIGVLVRIYQRLAGYGGLLRLAAVPGSVARVFKLTGLDQAIAVCATVADALAAGDGVRASSGEGAPVSVRAASER
ncbi:anti-sigma factor antagonist [Streptomyces sp. NPDC008121]|uniref:STAS domain-containing protein n=1 Tax=Streptomyces sp. NPDC008121 TaxID=3364809 RepID=UPI0036EF6EFA